MKQLRSVHLTLAGALLVSAHAAAEVPAPHTQAPLLAEHPASKYSAVQGIGDVESRSGRFMGVVIGPRALLLEGLTYCVLLHVGTRVLLDRPKSALGDKPAHLLPVGTDCASKGMPVWVVIEYADALNLPIAKVSATTVVKGIKGSFELVYFDGLGRKRLRGYVAHDGTRYTDGSYAKAIKLEEWAYTPKNSATVALLDVGSTSPIFYGFARVGSQLATTLGRAGTRQKPWFYNELKPPYVELINAIVSKMRK